MPYLTHQRLTRFCGRHVVTLLVKYFSRDLAGALCVCLAHQQEEVSHLKILPLKSLSLERNMEIESFDAKLPKASFSWINTAQNLNCSEKAQREPSYQGNFVP